MRLPVIASICLLAASAARISLGDPVDLSPRVQVGQRLEVTTQAVLTGALDDLLVTVEGEEVMGPEFGVELSFRTERTRVEEVLSSDGRDATAKRVDFIEQELETDFTSEQPGRSKARDGAFDLPVDDRSYLIRLDEDGDVALEDVSEEGLFDDDLADEFLEELTLAAPFADLLPSDPVSVGEPFEFETGGCTAGMLAEVSQGAAAVDGWEGMEGHALATGARWILNEVELEGTGTLREIEEGVAIIDYAMSGQFDVDDLVDMIETADRPDDPAPEGATGTLSGLATFKGVGRFDLAAGHLIELEFEGEVSARMDLSLGAEAMAEFAATITYQAALTAL